MTECGFGLNTFGETMFVLFRHPYSVIEDSAGTRWRYANDGSIQSNDGIDEKWVPTNPITMELPCKRVDQKR